MALRSDGPACDGARNLLDSAEYRGLDKAEVDRLCSNGMYAPVALNHVLTFSPSVNASKKLATVFSIYVSIELTAFLS